MFDFYDFGDQVVFNDGVGNKKIGKIVEIYLLTNRGLPKYLIKLNDGNVAWVYHEELTKVSDIKKKKAITSFY